MFHLRFVSISLLLTSLAGCGEQSGPQDAGTDVLTVDAPAVDAPSLDVPSLDAPTDDAPSDAPATDAAGEASVHWTTVTEPVTVDRDIALDYFYQYEVQLVGDLFAYDLDLERCVTIAGRAESCETSARDPLAFSSGIRWGVDPSMYAVGENRYRFTLSLSRDGTVIDTDTIELVLNVTACTDCVMP